MAVSIPSGIYSLGAVQFNTQPLATLEGQLLAKRAAREQAEQDAITKYVDAASQKVTPAGVRVKDLPDYFKQVDEWKKMGQTLTPNDKIGRLAFDQKGQKILAFIEQSKNADKEKEPYLNIVVDPTKRNSLDIDEAFKAIDLHDLPLNNPNRVSISKNTSIFNPPVYDFDKDYKEVFGSFKPSTLGVVPKSTNPQTGKLKVEKGLTDDAIKKGAEDFVFRIQNNPTSLSSFKVLSKNMPPKDIADLATEVHQYFPDLQVDADHPLAVAAGLAIKRAKVRYQEDETDAELEQRRALERSAVSAAARNANVPTYNLADYDIIRRNYTANPDKVKLIGGKKAISLKDIDSYDLDLITNKGLIDAYKDPTTKEQYFVVRDNGDLEGKKGQVISWQSVAKANLDRTTEKEQKVITNPVGGKGSGGKKQLY